MATLFTSGTSALISIPVHLAAFGGTNLFVLTIRADDRVSAVYLDCLTSFEPYAESVWHEANYPNSPGDAGYFGDGYSSGNGGIRGSTSVATAYAVLVRAFPNDPLKARRLERIRQALNYAASTHLSGPANLVCVNNKRWGNLPGHGQTGFWAATLGLACVLVQDQLPASTVAACQRALADEATYQASVSPLSGYVGDTKAEENAWNSNPLALAAAWMPHQTNAQRWLTAAKQYMVNTFTVPDTNGDPLASWITTTNLYPSFNLENHGFYHPSYQVDGGWSLGLSWLMARLGNQKLAAELVPFAEHNVLNVWRPLQRVILDSGELAYPSGLDWALHSYEQSAYFAWMAAHFNDPLARWTEGRMADLARYRQRINGDGRFVGESEANGFYREGVEALCNAVAWLHHQYADHPAGPVRVPEPYVAHYPDIKLICQRSQAGFVSVSYGPKIMGLIEPPAMSFPTDVYVTTPRLPGLIGIGALGKPRHAQLLHCATNAAGFEVHLALDCGARGTNYIFFKSVGDAVAIVETPHPSPAVSETNAPSFSIGIENHALTGGARLLAWNNGVSNIVARSGLTLFMSSQWVCVSGRQGMIAGPAGQFRYQAATDYNRMGAAEDTLEFLPRRSLAPHYAVFLPGASAHATAAAAVRVHWQLIGSAGVLSFPGGNGAMHELTVPHLEARKASAEDARSSSGPVFTPSG
jgi:hypothetical protein